MYTEKDMKEPKSYTRQVFASSIVAMSARRVAAAMVQMTSVNDTGMNFASCASFVREAARKGCKMIFFPENFSFMGAAPGEAQRIASKLDGPVMGQYLDLARESGVWLSLGGFQERVDGDERIYNTHVIVDASGQVRATYRKIHLFDVPMTGLVESKQALAGSELVTALSPVGTLGVSICYDMRFPELYQKLTFLHGAQVLLMPSAFAVKTGAAHWETVLRCRAIETQCYVVAAAQCGQHNTHGNKRCSWGHAVVFDPWGQCVASLDDPDVPGLATFEIDLDLVEETRANMPIHAHRRYDVYGDGPHAVPLDEERARERDAENARLDGMGFG